MSLIYDKELLKISKNNDFIECVCNTCKIPQQRQVLHLKAAIRMGKESFSCPECLLKSKLKRQTVVCLNCKKSFDGLISEKRKFCSKSCTATYNNLYVRVKKTKVKINKSGKKQYIANVLKQCKNCNSNFYSRYGKFCSHKCAGVFRALKFRLKYKKIIEGGDTKLTNSISGTAGIFKKYLISEHGEKCMKCGWNMVNPITNKAPIELNHIDGDCTNHNLKNLELLCPNCHSLTSTYKGLNKNKGNSTRYKIWKKNFTN